MTTAEMSTSLNADRFVWWTKHLWTIAVRDWFGAKSLWRETRYSWLGFTLIAGAIMRWIGNTEMITMHRENYNIAKKQNLQYDVKPGTRIRQVATRRYLLFIVLSIILSITTLILYFFYDDIAAAG